MTTDISLPAKTPDELLEIARDALRRWDASQHPPDDATDEECLDWDHHEEERDSGADLAYAFRLLDELASEHTRLPKAWWA